MVNQLYPVIDDIDPSWADIVVKASPDGAPLIDMNDIASITGSSTVTVGTRKGASGGRVLGRTTGEKSDEFSWTLYRTGFSKLIEALVPIAVSRGFVRGDEVLVGLVPFGVHVQHTPPGSVKIHEYICEGARLLAWNMDHAEGPDPDQVEVPLSIMNFAHLIGGRKVVLL